MKYLKISLLLILACSTLALTQPKRKNFTHDEHGNPSYYSVASLNSKCRVDVRVDTFTTVLEPFNSVSNQSLTNLVYLEGTKKIHLTTLVHRDSLAFYRYNIYENDTLALVTDVTPNKIDFFWPHGSSYPGHATVNLGNYNIENKKLKLEIYKTLERDKVSTVLFYNKPIKPAKLFLIYPLRKEKNRRFSAEMKNLSQGATIEAADDLVGLLFSIKNTDLNFIYHVFLKHKASGKTIALSNNWLYDFIQGHPYQIVESRYLSDKGDYELMVVPTLSFGLKAKPFTQKSTVFRFTVQQETTFTKKDIGLFTGALILTSGILMAFIKVRGSKKLTAEKRQKEIAQLQLQVVRSQLNPHFMFNALANIQNLMNQNDADNANRYLGKFARLTRHVLQNQELNTLQEEISLLEDYLQMEKLRFGFQYAIIIDDAIDSANVEIPAMLLQPFVENAVKHGISGRPEGAKILIRAEKEAQDLLLLVTDNGRGFNSRATYSGLGLQLSQNRIALWNQLYKDTPLLLNLTSDATGTEVKITLKYWL